MILKKIKLIDFRNYNNLYWEPYAGTNFINGSNAQGKTNLLEAIYFSGLGFSFRKKDRDVIKWDSLNTSLQATYEFKDMLLDVNTNISNDGKKKILINGAEDGRRYLPGHLGIVLFRPDDLEIIKGSPAKRRNFIDNELGIMDPFYQRSLKQFRRVVEQRNNLLRMGGKKNQETLKVWNEHFYQYGTDIIYGRIKILKKFFPIVRSMYKNISGFDEELEIKYLSTIKISGETDIKEIADNFNVEGKNREKEELLKKQTLFGPHRDDLGFFLNNKDVRHYASQGQIRSIVMALKTAQLKLFHLETGEYPILLLDDVLMELDIKRQEYLMQLITGKVQSFSTSTVIPDKINQYVDRVYFINKGVMKEGN